MADRYKIGKHFEAMMDALIESGRYASRNDIILEGLHLIEEKEALREWKLEKLREAIRKGAESGPGIPAETVFAELRERYSQKVDEL